MKKHLIAIGIVIILVIINILTVSAQSENQVFGGIKTNLEIKGGRAIITIKNMCWREISVGLFSIAQPISAFLLRPSCISIPIIFIPAKSSYVATSPRPVGFGIINYEVNIFCDVEFEPDEQIDLEQRAFVLGFYMIPF